MIANTSSPAKADAALVPSNAEIFMAQILKCANISNQSNIVFLKNFYKRGNLKWKMENVKKFYEFLKNDPAAGQELQDKFQKIKKSDANAAMTALIEFATQKGFVFTAEDLKQFEESVQVLSNDELQ